VNFSIKPFWTHLAILSLALGFLSAIPAGAVEKGEADSKYSLMLGYRSISNQDNGRQALEYSLLRSSAAGSFEFQGIRDQRHLSLEANYLNKHEYFGEAGLDYKGLWKAGITIESLHHNLEHYPAEQPERNDAFPPGADEDNPEEASVVFTDKDPGADYFVNVEKMEGMARVRAGSYPAHFQITYWRWHKNGRQQLRYLDENCTNCHMTSKTQSIDRTTEEVSASMDGHFGPVNLAVEGLYRQFRDHDPIPTDTFDFHQLRNGPADREHDEDPDSKIYSGTVKANTSLAGSVVAAASFTMGQRKNQSDLEDVNPVESKVDFKKGAGDFTFMPTARWTLNFRYRILDLDSDNNDQISADGLILFAPAVDHNPVPVRDNMDLRRSQYGATVTYRPYRKLTLKGDFQREDIHRSDTGGPVEAEYFTPTIVIDPVWQLPEDETINKAKATIFYRPFGTNKLKLNTWFLYTHSDDPAYGVSVEDGYEGFAGVSWKPTKYFGGNINLNAVKEDNKNYNRDYFNTDIPDTITSFDLDRHLKRQNFSVGVWVLPTDRIRLQLHYGYLHTHIKQDLLFGNQPTSDPDSSTNFAVEDTNVEYHQKVHTATGSVNVQILETLNMTVEGRYIRSRSDFSPDFSVSGLEFEGGIVSDVDSSELRDLSIVNIRQYGGSIGLSWFPAPTWTCDVRATYDTYDDLNDEVFDGNVATYWASLSKTW